MFSHPRGVRRVVAVPVSTAAAWRSTLFALLCAPLAMDATAAGAFLERSPQDEIVYFLLPDRFENADPSNDRGGLDGGRLVNGFDATSRGFYHGGDLKGVIAHLDYIRSLGATALWIAPVMKNKPVQGAPGEESAGYHGYWVTDFTHVDPHFGTEADLHALIEAAHARGMKVFLDIIANHTADVIAYRECPARACPYRPRSEFPRGYTPYVPPGQEHIKVPEWLNDTAYYHNRGNSTFAGESSRLGDFSGLDDLMTESPRVVQGFIDIYGAWIDEYHIDGYRIDTARHVNPEFWAAFIPAMRERAAADGIPNFYVFGEVAIPGTDVAQLARYTRGAKFPAVLDFAFQSAVRAAVAGNAGTEVLGRVFAQDMLYEGGERTAGQLPTFIDNHDMGRFAWLVRVDRPQASDDEVLKRVMLAHAMLLTLRGVPVIYYGDEQGFAGNGGDQSARQDMFATRVPEYQADRRRIGVSEASVSRASFDQTHPLYRAIAELSALRMNHEALRRGRQVVRSVSERPGLFAVSRIDETNADEIIVAFNTSGNALDADIKVEASSERFSGLHGSCEPRVIARGRYHVTLAPLDFVICAAGEHE